MCSADAQGPSAPQLSRPSVASRCVVKERPHPAGVKFGRVSQVYGDKMPNNVDRDSSTGWLLAMIVALLIAIALTWANSGRWAGHDRRGETAAENNPAHHVAGTSTGIGAANNGTMRAASSARAASNQAPSGHVSTGLQSTAAHASVSTMTTGANLSTNGSPNASGSLSSTAPAPTAASDKTR